MSSSSCISRPKMNIDRDKLGSIILIALLLTFFLWQTAHLGGFERDGDEGVHFMEARLVQEGYRLYSEVFCASLPVFMLSIVGAFELLGTSVEAGRAVIVVYATLGLLGVALAAQELKGKASGITAVLLLAIVPDFFHWSRGSLGDLPSVSLATLSVAFALRYHRLGSKHCLVLTGLALGTSLMTKLTPIATLIPMISLVFLAQDTHSWRERIRTVIFLLLLVALPIVVFTLGYGRAMIDQAIVQHLRARRAYGLDIYQNMDWMVSYFAENIGLVALAIGGSIVLLAQVEIRKRVVILILWFLAMGLSHC